MPPPSAEARFSRPADAAACREMIRTGSRSFFMASLLLPDDVRDAAYALYGFCRLSDDAVDIEGAAPNAVPRLRARLNLIYAGSPAREPVDRALTDAVRQHGIPRAAMDALLEGLEWDAQGRTYETLSEVYDYAARVAGSVGAMMAALMGARKPDLAARACDLGVAMQLTNIARDVGEDARNGRLYLPRAWMREAGLDPDAWLAAPVYQPEIGEVIARLLRAADDLYRRADGGIANLDPAFRPAIFAARHLYSEIGVKLRHRGLDSVSRRTRVSTVRKLFLLGRAMANTLRAPSSRAWRVRRSPKRGFLVEAVGATSALNQPNRGRGRFRNDLVWILDLFASLETRVRHERSAARAVS